MIKLKSGIPIQHFHKFETGYNHSPLQAVQTVHSNFTSEFVVKFITKLLPIYLHHLYNKRIQFLYNDAESSASVHKDVCMSHLCTHTRQWRTLY